MHSNKKEKKWYLKSCFFFNCPISGQTFLFVLCAITASSQGLEVEVKDLMPVSTSVTKGIFEEIWLDRLLVHPPRKVIPFCWS